MRPLGHCPARLGLLCNPLLAWSSLALGGCKPAVERFQLEEDRLGSVRQSECRFPQLLVDGSDVFFMLQGANEICHGLVGARLARARQVDVDVT